MNIRHINRGDIKEGGCSMCKPRVSRWGWYRAPKDLQDNKTEVEEFMDEMHEDHDDYDPWEDV